MKSAGYPDGFYVDVNVYVPIDVESLTGPTLIGRADDRETVMSGKHMLEAATAVGFRFQTSFGQQMAGFILGGQSDRPWLGPRIERRMNMHRDAALGLEPQRPPQQRFMAGG